MNARRSLWGLLRPSARAMKGNLALALLFRSSKGVVLKATPLLLAIGSATAGWE